MKHLTIYLIVIVIISSCAQGNNFGIDHPEEHIEKFFELYKNQSPEVALDYIYSDDMIQKGDELIQTIEKMKAQLNGLESIMGKFHSHDLIKTEKIGKSIVASSYFANYEQQPILFIFVFYKPKDKWNFYYFNYSDGIERNIIQNLQEIN